MTETRELGRFRSKAALDSTGSAQGLPCLRLSWASDRTLVSCGLKLSVASGAYIIGLRERMRVCFAGLGTEPLLKGRER
ncbi:hypothetical protein McaMca56_002226 [Microsporum canis]